MEGQHPLTIGLLVAVGALALFVVYHALRTTVAIAQSVFKRGPAFDLRAYSAALPELVREVASLPLASARAEAERLLVASPHLKGRTATGAPDAVHLAALAQLAPLQRELFTRYEWIGSADEESFVAHEEIAPLDSDGAYLRLGAASSDGHLDVAARPGEEAVFHLASDEKGPERVELAVGSIYHWLVYLHREVELSERCSREPATAA